MPTTDALIHVVPPVRWRVARLGTIRAIPMRVRDPQSSPILREARRTAFARGVRAEVELFATDDVDRLVDAVARRLGATVVVGCGAR